MVPPEFLLGSLAFASGVVAHLAVFRKGEWDVASPSVFVFYLFSFVLISLPVHFQLGVPLLAAAKLAGCHVAGLFASMLVYRGWFHRLSSYPGPFLARITTFYITARSMKKLHLYEEVQKLHEQHGDYVRLAPRELSIAAPEAVRAIYGTQSPTTKGPWYTLLEPRVPLFMARDKQEHARRRKPRITESINQLLDIVERHQRAGQSMDVTKFFAFFVFDVMEALAFNRTSNMLVDEKEAYVFETIRADMFNIALFTHLPWLLPFLKRTPILNRNYLKFWDWIQDQVDERSRNEPKARDIFSYILEAYRNGPKTKRDKWNLHGDAQLIVIAGSDSVAAVLTHVFYFLAIDPTLAGALRTEFDALPDLSHENLVTVPLLDAIINETMRLHPPVASGTQRVTPPEGVWIGERHIPGDVIVQVPSYTVFRDPRAFEQPNEFIPERWTTRPELIRDRSVFIPFNIGPYACVGKRLALLEIRRVVGEVLARYHITPADSQSVDAFLEAKEDTFTTVSGTLPLIFTPREKVSVDGAL
ncbi:cytochrome P450 monooxygenase-like protein [Cercophora newfieldiana]|uniref:Cytochrome P450 monooxygenase-like protein n=1 Tax=Cercophora newfieldiana TaxID=92897 RepID=A0AA39YCB5_9PEZI|nr:cytochrome P450 monooxygenase-like protein [Cercophora newfieldiana]